MPSNLDFDSELLREAQRLGGHKFKKDTVNSALREYVDRRKQWEVMKLFHTVEYDPKYDYKRGRKNR